MLTLLRESGRHSKSSVKGVAIFLFWAIKSTLITVRCHENVPRLLLQQLRCYMSGKIKPNPGPVSALLRLLVRSIAP